MPIIAQPELNKCPRKVRGLVKRGQGLEPEGPQPCKPTAAPSTQLGAAISTWGQSPPPLISWAHCTFAT
jgi:hypothetical protein